ncbi:hypothetical protein FRC01_013736 [Tulasnella sp. 417]|nr:hypothetical protein FRC01_013736 [Tulasnella sp. 417]
MFEDKFFLVSKFAEYGDIIRYLRTRKDGQILRLLEMVHCDIKPDNILLTGDEKALPCDFATVKGDGAASSANSASQRTALYLSPECLEGDTTRTTVSDMSPGLEISYTPTHVYSRSPTIETLGKYHSVEWVIQHRLQNRVQDAVNAVIKMHNESCQAKWRVCQSIAIVNKEYWKQYRYVDSSDALTEYA